MKVTALIVTYNRLDKLKRCLNSTLTLGFSSVVVVNNASTDDTALWLSTLSDERLTVINQSRNLGGAGGFFAGSSYICNHIDTEWVFFYDDDAYPDENLLSSFEYIADDNNAAYASLVTDLSGNICRMNLPFIRLPSTIAELLQYSRSANKFVPDITKPAMVKTLSFVGACINKKVLDANLNSIRTDLFIYYDDLYFGYDLSLQGLNIRFSPELLFKHDINLNSKNIYPEWKVYYLIRNLLLSLTIYKRNRPYSFQSIIFRLVKYFLLTVRQKNKVKYIKYCLKACIHGIRGVTGKQH